MNAKIEIHVNIGEIALGHEGVILKSLLGSCVGIAMHNKLDESFALAHCLLPDDPEGKHVDGAKYVSWAVPTMLKMLKLSKGQYKSVDTFIAGGANMMDQLCRPNVDHIGLLNIAAAKKYLTSYGLNYRIVDVGGDEARQMFVDCSIKEVYVNRFKKTLLDLIKIGKA